MKRTDVRESNNRTRLPASSNDAKTGQRSVTGYRSTKVVVSAEEAFALFDRLIMTEKIRLGEEVLGHYLASGDRKI